MSGRPGGPSVLLAGWLALLLAGLLGGCASIPSSGRVVAGGDVNQQGVRSALRVTAAGPVEDADQRQIVEGFLAAVAGLDDYTVARQFLAADAQDWRPGEQTVVYEGVPSFAPTTTGGDRSQVTVRASVVGRIDESGRYVEQAPTVEELQFGLVQQDGQWRIADLPPGVLVSELDQDRVLAPFGVYFVDPTETYLVPDVRWFPQSTSSATPLVRALLGGPSAPYLGALQSAAPLGTTLDLPTVPVENGVATVDLTEEFLLADADSRALFLAQLRQSLRAVPGVSSVTVTVDGGQLEEPQGSEAVDAPTLVVDPGVDTRPYVLAPPETETEDGGAAAAAAEATAAGDARAEATREATQEATREAAQEATQEATQEAPDGATGVAADPQVDPRPELAVGPDGRPLAPEGSVVMRLDLDGTTPVEGTEALTQQVRTGLAVSQDGAVVAGLDAARRSLLLQEPGSSVVELVTGRGLTTPSFDPPELSWVWTVTEGDAQGATAPEVLAAASSVEQVEAGWLQPGDQVRALRVSRDGARVLVVLARAGGGVQVQVRGVRRDATGRPLSLSQAAFDVAPDLVDAVDAAWVNDDTVVVLGRSGEEPLRPVLAQVGGMTEPLAPTPGAATVSAGLGARSVVVGTSDGTVLRRSGGVWLDGPFGVSPAHGG